MKILKAIAFLLIVNGYAGAQPNTWNIQIDYNQRLEDSESIILVDSFYLSAGGEYWSNPYDINTFIVKMDLAGNVIWKRSYDHGSDPINFMDTVGGAHTIIHGDNGHSYVHGNALVYKNGVLETGLITLMKIANKDGSPAWIKYFDAGPDNGYGSNRAIRTKDGGIAIIGWTVPDVGRGDMVLIKTDSEGNLNFKGLYKGQYFGWHHTGISLIQTPDDGFLLVGHTTHSVSSDYYLDLVIIKTDKNGNKEWSRTHRHDSNLQKYKYPSDIVPTSDGNYLISGYKLFGDIVELAEYTIYKISPNGDLLWEKGVGGNHHAIFERMITTSDGDFALVGYEQDVANTDPDLYRRYGTIARITQDGCLKWIRRYTESPDHIRADRFYDIVQNPDGGFTVAGTNFGPWPDSTYRNVWVMRTDSLGCLEPGCDSDPRCEPYTGPLYVGLGDSVEHAPLVDQDSTTVGISELGEKQGLLVFPNPFNESVNFDFGQGDGQSITVKVMNVQGVLLWEHTTTDTQVTWKPKSLPAGMYFYTVTADGVMLKSGKLYYTK